MATVYATFSFEVKPGVSSNVGFGDLFNPVVVEVEDVAALQNDRVTIASTGTLTITDTPRVLAVLSDVDMAFGWSGSTDADNSSIELEAGLPFFLFSPSTTAKADRFTDEPIDIETLKFYNGSGGSAVVKIFILSEA